MCLGYRGQGKEWQKMKSERGQNIQKLAGMIRNGGFIPGSGNH